MKCFPGPCMPATAMKNGWLCILVQTEVPVHWSFLQTQTVQYDLQHKLNLGTEEKIFGEILVWFRRYVLNLSFVEFNTLANDNFVTATVCKSRDREHESTCKTYF